jgi:hypothetical protein
MTVHQQSNVRGVLNSDNWGGRTVCVTNSGGTANFTATKSAGSYTGGVLAYPDINVGCQGGYCTTSSELPAAESSITPEVTWSTNSPQNGSKFDTGLNMANFYADAISNGNLPAGQYLTDIGAGNEIWANGVGLSTTNLLISGLLRLGPGRPRGSMGRAGRLAGQGGVWPLMLSGRFWRP